MTPGTTSYGMPAAARHSSSSPPRPNTNGSPPFSRTTRRPARACSSISSWIRDCDTDAPRARLPTSIRVASRRARPSTSAETSRSCRITSASCSARSAFSVSSPGSPGPAPTSATDPRDCPGAEIDASIQRSAATVSPRRRCKAAPSRTAASYQRRRVPTSGSAARIRDRQRWNRPASAPMDSSSTDSMRSRTSRASTGATPPVDTAITSGERSTIAGTMKPESSASSTTFASRPRASAAAATRALIARSSVAATARTTSSS